MILLLLFLGSLAYIKIFLSNDPFYMSQKEPVHLTPTQFKFNDKTFYVFCTALSFLFIIIVAFTSQYKNIRYIWPVAPISIIFVLFLIKLLIDVCFKFSVKIKRIIFILTTIFCNLRLYDRKEVYTILSTRKLKV
ncbi:MAG: hypothetical protein LBD57_02510 [Endomicrobium sp.]|uniref:hypothetical protein n=1 Tax=Candidatus Endomicrobiellum cubanum TaxID=3242325 RepID=UPI00282FA248|nr:hypothetical protein [Endomicrobium sp.]